LGRDGFAYSEGVNVTLSTATPVRRLALAAIIALGFAAFISEYVSIHWDSDPGPGPQRHAEFDLTKSTLRIRVDPVGVNPGGYQWGARGWDLRSIDRQPRRWLPSIQTDFWSFSSTAIVVPLWLLVFVVSVAAFGLG
jgi:hypothetical protein